MRVTPTRLGEVLTLERRVASPSLSGLHHEIGVRSFGRGLFVKDAVTGASLGDKRVFHVHPGDLVVSNVFAWEGGVALADERHEGTIGSHRFMTWTSKGNRADLRYVVHFLLSEAGLRLLGQASPGSAGRNRTLSIVNFQNLVVPLPDLPEQRRIAAYLDEVQVKVHDAIGREPSAAARVTDAWLEGVFHGLIADTPLGEVSVISRGVTPSFASSKARIVGQASVRWEGLDAAQFKPVDDVWERAVPADRRTRAGDLLLNSTGEGTIGRACLVDPKYEGLVTDSKVLTIRPEECLASGFLAIFLRSPQGRRAVNDAKGANTTKQTELGKARAERLLVPLPGMEIQAAHVSAWDAVSERLGQLDRLARKRAVALSALLSAARNEVFSAMR